MTRLPGLAAGVGGLLAGSGLIATVALAQAETGAPPTPQPAAPVEAVRTVPGAPPLDPSDPWMWGDVATLRGLDKVTAATRDFEARVGEDVEFLGLTISVKRCAKRPPERQPEVIVGMEIFDRRIDERGRAAEAVTEAAVEGADDSRIFAGWMFASSPALNPLEHPVFDVWVLDCVNSLAPVVEPPAEAADPEAADDAAPAEGPLPGEVFD